MRKRGAAGGGEITIASTDTDNEVSFFGDSI